MFPTFLIWVYFFQRVDPELPASKSPGLPVKNTKSWLYPIYIELGEGGRRNPGILILNKHFRGLSCTFEFESHCFESLNVGAY